MRLGITASREGPTRAQRRTFVDLIRAGSWEELHHGCCVGGDAVGHWVFRLTHERARIVGHPGPDPEAELVDRMVLRDCDELRDPETHFKRNRGIVSEVKEMIAMPPTMMEHRHGGTWYTIRHAIKAGCPLTIVFPDGSTETHNQPCGTASAEEDQDGD